MSTAYLARLPREYMRIAAGFPRTAGNYHLRRAAVLLPVALERRIWPWVDGWLARYDASIVSGRSFANGGLDDCDIAGKQFLDLLAWLRITMLQDAAVLQQQFPLFPLWQHPIFCGPDWRRFADAVLVAHNTAEEPMDMRVRRVLPTLEETMRSTREAVLARVDLHSASIELAPDEVSYSRSTRLGEKEGALGWDAEGSHFRRRFSRQWKRGEQSLKSSVNSRTEVDD